MDLSKKIANNILEFLVNPRAFPVERRLYFRPEEILDNTSYENAVADADKAYGDQGHNSDFYPNRNRSTKREALSMDRKTLIASMDILSQSFTEEDPIGKDLRTMAYAVSKMSDEELQGRLTDVEAGKGLPPWLMKDDKGNVVKNPDYKKKAEETEPESKEATESEKVSEEEKTVSSDIWSKEASDAVQRALISDVIGDVKANDEDTDDDEEGKEAGKKKGPGIPDGTGPMSGTPKCPMTEEKEVKEPAEKKAEGEKPVEAEEKKAEEPEKKAEEKKPVEAEEKKAEKEKADEPAEEKKADEPVDTDILATVEVGGIELSAGMTTMDDIGDLSDEEQNRLSQLFQ